MQMEAQNRKLINNKKKDHDKSKNKKELSRSAEAKVVENKHTTNKGKQETKLGKLLKSSVDSKRQDKTTSVNISY